MIPNRIKILLLALAIIFSTDVINGQDKKKLENSKKKLEKEIGYTRKLLNETSNQKKSSLNEISLLNKQIINRTELINVLNREVQMADGEINRKRNEINRLEEDLKRLKAEYSRLIYQSYKARNQADQWMFVFSSHDFYQAYKRIKYIRAISETRKEAAQKILTKETEIHQQIAAIQAIKNNRLIALQTKEVEAKELINDKSRKEVAVKNIIQKEKDLKSKLAQQQKEWAKLNDEIKKIIAAQMKSTKPSEPNKIPLTPDEQQLANDFALNKGKLPWPSERGQITSHFGLHPHPELKIDVDNKGVDIMTEKGTVARAVFGGKVIRILQINKFKAVLIQHGSYFTVYSNLSDVYVSEGQQVKTKQSIGMIGTESDSGETILHFELWNSKSNSPQNPESWIAK